MMHCFVFRCVCVSVSLLQLQKEKVSKFLITVLKTAVDTNCQMKWHECMALSPALHIFQKNLSFMLHFLSCWWFGNFPPCQYLLLCRLWAVVKSSVQHGYGTSSMFHCVIRFKGHWITVWDGCHILGTPGLGLFSLMQHHFWREREREREREICFKQNGWEEGVWRAVTWGIRSFIFK